MKAVAGMEHFGIFDRVASGLLCCSINIVSDPFGLEGVEEGVIIGVIVGSLAVVAWK